MKRAMFFISAIVFISVLLGCCGAKRRLHGILVRLQQQQLSLCQGQRLMHALQRGI